MKVILSNDSSYYPKYHSKYAAGVDLYATSVKKKKGFLFPLYEYKTGIKMEIPNGFFAMVTPRSSISKKFLMLANSVGIIDSDYRGEIILKFRGLLGYKPYKIGDRIGQMILLRRSLFEFEKGSLTSTERGEGGFGSTGK